MAYIVESNLNIRNVTVERSDGEFSVISLDDFGGRLMVRSKRIYGTVEEACRHLPHGNARTFGAPGMTGLTPWDYRR